DDEGNNAFHTAADTAKMTCENLEWSIVMLKYPRAAVEVRNHSYGTNVERNRGEHLIRRFVGRGNEPDPRDVKIASLKQRIQELEFP
ncbi:hypothetical protein Tco_1321728, partial [Tanacetum coccineum]